MAVGFSGSNGGIAKEYVFFSTSQKVTDIPSSWWYREFYPHFPLQMSFFGNNHCNLACAHCYADHVGPRFENLSVDAWCNIVNQGLKLGVRIVGIVGKEPIISKSWFQNNTLPMLQHLQRQKKTLDGVPLLYGLVSNGTRLDSEIGGQLTSVSIDYLDISLDGNREFHDQVRGTGNFDRTLKGLRSLPEKLLKRVFISFTMMNGITTDSILALVQQVEDIGVKHFLISPYCTAMRIKEDVLYLDQSTFVDMIERIIDRYQGAMEFLVKTEPLTSKKIMDELVARKHVDLEKLRVDTYGTLFTKIPLSDNGSMCFNWYPVPDISFINQFRLASNGKVGTCYDMFFPWADRLAIGNAITESLADILVRGQKKVWDKAV